MIEAILPCVIAVAIVLYDNRDRRKVKHRLAVLESIVSNGEPDKLYTVPAAVPVTDSKLELAKLELEKHRITKNAELAATKAFWTGR